MMDKGTTAEEQSCRMKVTVRKEEVTLKYGGYDNEKGKVILNLDMGVGIGGDKWPAADLFCFLAASTKLESFFNQLFDGKRVLDLGSGTGLTSILLYKLFPVAIDICVTDLESHIEHIKANIALNVNALKHSDLNSAHKTSIRARAFDWLKIPQGGDEKRLGSFDIIFAFECVYKEELYVPFINALLESSHSSTVIFLGLTRIFAKPLFFDVLKSSGFVYTMVPQEALPEGFGNDTTGRDVGLFIVTLSKRR
jgi:SAM-dependent methyltransferase